MLPPAGVRVLLIGSDYPTFLANVQDSLNATGAFTAVDVYNALYSTPTLPYLLGYSAVLVDSDIGFNSSTGLGNVLAAYWDAGGAVVLSEFSLGALPGLWPQEVQGSFGNISNGYVLVNYTAGYQGPPDTLGKVLEPNSPLMADVKRISANDAFQSLGDVINGGIVVAEWATGSPLIVRGTRAGRPLVALNLFPVLTGPWNLTGDVGPLLRNALLYSTCRPGHPGEACVPCLKCDGNATDSGCPAGSASINTCTCKAGFSGNGLYCDAD